MTGKVRASGASSGIQIFSQTSQLACPVRLTRVPGTRSAGGVTGIGRTTESEYPYVMTDPTLMRSGSGQANSPTVKPGGKLHSIRGASPESPGFIQ